MRFPKGPLRGSSVSAARLFDRVDGETVALRPRGSTPVAPPSTPLRRDEAIKRPSRQRGR